MTISAKIIHDSVSQEGKRITTYELEYPRFIHSEFMTHRQFSRNCASSRAIPIEKMQEQVTFNPATPHHWGKNQSGMQAHEELVEDALLTAQSAWNVACHNAVHNSRELANTGLHKQIANRVLEPFQHMKTVVTATEWDNWFWLRFHSDAQPEIHQLARLMLDCRIQHSPTPLYPGEWHVPYITRKRNEKTADMEYYTESGEPLTLEQARVISVSCCAQVSYRKNDDTLEKAQQIYKRLITSEPVHASPTEHQATPMQRAKTKTLDNWEPGTTHIHKSGWSGSGNFYGWTQFRQLIPNHSK